MAVTGWSTSNFLRYAGAPITAAPMSFSAWAWTSVIGNTQTIGGLWNSAAASQARHNLTLRINVAGTVRAVIGDGASSAFAETSASISTSTWFHGCAVFAAADSRAAYLNGGNKGTDTTSITPTGIDRTSLGVADFTSQSLNLGTAGTAYLAEVGMWDVALTDAEVLILSKGFSPLLVRPANLVAYWPLIQNGGRNYMDRTAVFTTVGTLSAAPHCRVIMPHSQGFVMHPAVVGGARTDQFFIMF